MNCHAGMRILLARFLSDSQYQFSIEQESTTTAQAKYTSRITVNCSNTLLEDPYQSLKQKSKFQHRVFGFFDKSFTLLIILCYNMPSTRHCSHITGNTEDYNINSICIYYIQSCIKAPTAYQGSISSFNRFPIKGAIKHPHPQFLYSALFTCSTTSVLHISRVNIGTLHCKKACINRDDILFRASHDLDLVLAMYSMGSFPGGYIAYDTKPTTNTQTEQSHTQQVHSIATILQAYKF